jgi:predicted acylesterase/phospholipase RssA
MVTRRTGAVLLLLALGVPVACAQRRLNLPIETHAPEAGHRLVADGAGHDHDLLVILAFSGGGTRAAALSYGVLEELRDTRIRRPRDGSTARLLDEVDLISSVSGGSFTSAYYGLYGDRIFEDFDERVLNRDIQGELLLALAGPRSWFRLASGTFDRIDLAAEIYDESIFDGKTFADLRADGPFVVINATNVTTGCSFPFTQEVFDFLGSDLDAYPVANAVAASSAVPMLFSPITLRNHPAPAGFEPPAWIREGEGRRDRRLSRCARALMLYHRDKKGHPYLHLVDGGVSDNTGLRTVLDQLRWGCLRDLLADAGGELDHPEARPGALLVIVVNAMNRLGNELDLDESSPGLLDTVLYSMCASIDVNTFGIVQQMEDLFERRRKARERGEAPATRLYLVEVAFEGLADPAERKRFESMPTSLSLEEDQVGDLVRVGREILRGHDEFRRFLRDLAPTGPGAGE